MARRLLILMIVADTAAANTAVMFFPNLDWTVYNMTVLIAALVVILVDRMWIKLPPTIWRCTTRRL